MYKILLALDHRQRANHWRAVARSFTIAGDDEASAECRRAAEMWDRQAADVAAQVRRQAHEAAAR